MITKIPFDDKAHAILIELLDTTAGWLARRRECEPQSANDRLASDYITQCSSVIWGATSFIPADERIGTDIFISQLRGASSKLRSSRTRRACVAQLVRFPQIYFPNYLTVLQIALQRELQQLETRCQIKLSGVVKLAAANIRDVRNEIRRLLCRLGDETTTLIVPDDILERQLARF